MNSVNNINTFIHITRTNEDKQYMNMLYLDGVIIA